jgi:hypothetical protein
MRGMESYRQFEFLIGIILAIAVAYLAWRVIDSSAAPTMNALLGVMGLG